MKKLINSDNLEAQEFNYDEGFQIEIYKELTEDEVNSIVGAVGYAQKVYLRSPEELILADASVREGLTLIDIAFDFSEARRSDFDTGLEEFFSAAKDYIQNGKRHKGAGITLGSIGNHINVKFYVYQDFLTEDIYTITLKTILSQNALLEKLADTEIRLITIDKH